MPNRARLIYQCLKLVTFIAVLIAAAWSVWRLLSSIALSSGLTFALVGWWEIVAETWSALG
jgi:hypothetical protein